MKILLSQKNRFFDLIERHGLTPRLFEFKEILNNKGVGRTIIQLKNSLFYFSISKGESDTGQNCFVSDISPGDYEYQEKRYNYVWDQIESSYENWLGYLKRELQLEDKWEKFNSEIQSLQLYHEENDSFNSKFTVPEYLEIKQKIFLLKEGMSKLELLPEQIALLNDKLDMVLDMTTQLGRFDWKSLFVGTIVSIIIQLGVTQDNAKAIWALIKQVFHNYFIGQ